MQLVKCLFRPADCRVTTEKLIHTLLFISTQKQENVKESGWSWFPSCVCAKVLIIGFFPQLMNYCMEFWKSLYKNSAVFRVNTSPTVSSKVATDFFEKNGIRSSLFWLERFWSLLPGKIKPPHLINLWYSFFFSAKRTNWMLFYTI